jgi:hypothetical protein
MFQTRFRRIRAMVGIAVLSLALLAGIAGTTQPAEARPIDDFRWLCDAMGGSFAQRAGMYTTFECTFSDGTTVGCTVNGTVLIGCRQY